MKSDEGIILQVGLIELGMRYLALQRRITHKEYTIADLFEVCEKILRFSEHRRHNHIKFIKNGVKISGNLV